MTCTKITEPSRSHFLLVPGRCLSDPRMHSLTYTVVFLSTSGAVPLLGHESLILNPFQITKSPITLPSTV